MAHITRISRVPWTTPKNYLGCKTPPPGKRDKRESLFATSETSVQGQFDDASPVRHGPFDGYEYSATQTVVANEGDDAFGEGRAEGTPSRLGYHDAPILTRAVNGASANQLDYSEEDGSNSQNTPSTAATGGTTQGKRCRMEALLLAAEHAVSPNPYRKKRDTNDSLKKEEGPCVVGKTIPESMNTWHWYSIKGGSGNDYTPSTVATNKELDSREDQDLPHTVTYGDEDTEVEEAVEEEDDNSESEDSDATKTNFDLYDQTVLVIRDGIPQYTVYRRPTPTKAFQDGDGQPTSSPDDTVPDNPAIVSFEERIVQIENYKRAHGHLSNFTAEHRSLSQFISNQRSKYIRGLLNPARAKRLRSLKVPGFAKKPTLVNEGAPNKPKNAKSGRQQGKAAVSNKPSGTKQQSKSASSRRGKSKSSPTASTDEPAPKRQRVARPLERHTEGVLETKKAKSANNSLATAPRKKKAKSPPKKAHGKRGQPHLFVTFDERIVQLEKYQEKHGHISVPANKKKNPEGELGRWLAAQRSLHRKRTLKSEKAEALRRLKCDGF